MVLRVKSFVPVPVEMAENRKTDRHYILVKRLLHIGTTRRGNWIIKSDAAVVIEKDVQGLWTYRDERSERSDDG